MILKERTQYVVTENRELKWKVTESEDRNEVLEYQAAHLEK